MADISSVIPNFFIVGAPKCGTTSLYEYLRQHPEVFMPDFKEPHFFGNDLHKNNDVYFNNDQEYLKLFHLGMNKKLIGEASTHYLYSNSAPAEIYNFNPASKIIILLRNPVELIYSLHSQYVFSGNENLVDFKEALNAEEKRKLGQNLPPYIDMMEKVFYKSYIHRLPKQIKSFLKIFKENVLILLLDDLINDVDKTYVTIINFLDIDPSYKPDFSIQNPNKKPRSIFVRNLMKKYGIKVGKLRKYLFNKSLGVMQNIEKMNTEYIKRKPMEASLRSRLQIEFIPVIEELEIILQRNLSNWKN